MKIFITICISISQASLSLSQCRFFISLCLYLYQPYRSFVVVGQPATAARPAQLRARVPPDRHQDD